MASSASTITTNWWRPSARWRSCTNRAAEQASIMPMSHELEQKLQDIEQQVRMPLVRFHDDHHQSRGVAAQGAQGQDRDGRGQSAPRYFHREEVHEPRALVPRFDPGRQHGPDEGGGEIRVPPRLQVFDLRHLVDSAGDHALHRRPGAHDPHSGAHDRDDQQADARAEAAGAGIRPRAHAGRSGRGNLSAGGTRPRGPAHGAAADLAPGPGGRQRRHDLRRFHRGQVGGESLRDDGLRAA